ncbi:MAG: arsenate reductase family protein [Atopobiaceae bacterium]|nr:arsenate reductase family protein [Atopobiaceae bacterium]
MLETLLFLQYPRCGTCRKARAWLDAHGIAYNARHIVEKAPTAEELAQWLSMSGLPVRRLFNTSGKRYRELGMKDRFAEGISEAECLELLASDGMLVKRPILVGEDFALVGFKETEWVEKLLVDAPSSVTSD